MATRKQQYDVALNGQGLILSRSPQVPNISAKQEQIFYLRYNQGDHNYNDLSKYWYMAQTDWSGGFKDNPQWADDAQFYYSSNIDCFSEVGAFKLFVRQIPQHTFHQNVICAVDGIISGTEHQFFGTDKDVVDGINKIIVFDENYNSIGVEAQVSPNATAVSQLLPRNGFLWVFAAHAAASVGHLPMWDGAVWGERSAAFASVLDFTPTSFRCGVDIGGTLFIACDNTSNNSYAIVSTNTDTGVNSTDWNKVVEKISTTGIIVDMANVGGDLFYLVNYGHFAELRVFQIASATDVSIGFFQNTNLPTFGVGGRLLVVVENLLYITIPDNEIWLFDIATGNFSRVYLKDAIKKNIGVEATGYLFQGGVVSGNKAYWGNLITDPANGRFYNWIRDVNDNNSVVSFYPLMNDNSGNIWGTDLTNPKIIYKITPPTQFQGFYKGQNQGTSYIVFSNYDKISGVDKFAFSGTVICKALAAGQKITVEYATDSFLTLGTVWTQLGVLDFAVDGAITQKNLFFGDAVIFKKMWFRIKLDASGADTPSFYDFALAYLPWPDRKLEWQFTVKCEDQLIRKDGTKEVKSGVWIRNFLRQSWHQKTVMTYEDYDASASTMLTDGLTTAATTIIDVVSTDLFPESGRILIEQEEIFYNGKTKSQFLNCVRGYNGTNAVPHAQSVAVSLAYRVLINDYSEDLIVANDANKAEYLVTLSVREV